MSPFDSAPMDGFGSAPPSSSRFAFEEIGWIADLAIAIALRRGVDPAALLAGGAALTDAHRDAEPLLRLARDRRLVAPARALVGGRDVVVASSFLCLGLGFPAGFLVPGTVLASVHLDRRPDPGRPGALHGRFGSVLVRSLSEAGVEEPPGDSFRVLYAPAADLGRWPNARPAEPVGEMGLWPSAHMAFG
ncbi:hypothetical protein [Stella sp.]|uniref:hypothetical protein n=1 Tax=Stella sp. TaxID=2912054 RepID=UPI0035B03D83